MSATEGTGLFGTTPAPPGFVSQPEPAPAGEQLATDPVSPGGPTGLTADQAAVQNSASAALAAFLGSAEWQSYLSLSAVSPQNPAGIPSDASTGLPTAEQTAAALAARNPPPVTLPAVEAPPALTATETLQLRHLLSVLFA